MNIKSERGQAVIVLALIALGIFALVAMAMATNSKGMAEGADAIGAAAGDAIDSISVKEPAFDGTYMSWKGSQTLFPNKHADLSHGDYAWKAVNCYNKNGAFHVMRLKSNEFHLFCRDDDGSIGDVILQRQGNSNKFDFVNAFLPKLETGNLWDDILNWMIRKGAGKGSMPNDAVIIIDGVIP